jgi:hypothetical protein
VSDNRLRRSSSIRKCVWNCPYLLVTDRLTILQRRFKVGSTFWTIPILLTLILQAALEAYQERELPNARKEHPGLRLQQYKDLLYKQFQKSPENP